MSIYGYPVTHSPPIGVTSSPSTYGLKPIPSGKYKTQAFRRPLERGGGGGRGLVQEAVWEPECSLTKSTTKGTLLDAAKEPGGQNPAPAEFSITREKKQISVF